VEKNIYPQLFLRIGQSYSYVGDYPTIQKAVDEGRLESLLNLSESTKGNIETETKDNKDDTKGHDIEFMLRQYKGSKIWKLTPQECESLWYALDRKKRQCFRFK